MSREEDDHYIARTVRLYEKTIRRAKEAELLGLRLRGERRDQVLGESIRLRAKAQGVVNELTRRGVRLTESPGGITWRRDAPKPEPIRGPAPPVSG